MQKKNIGIEYTAVILFRKKTKPNALFENVYRPFHTNRFFFRTELYCSINPHYIKRSYYNLYIEHFFNILNDYI